MENPILTEEIQSVVLPALRNYVLVSSPPLPRSLEPMVQAFRAAVEAMSKSLRTPTRVHVVFAASPFTVNLENGVLTYTPKEHVINAAVEGFIFLDCNKMAGLQWEIQVACILEELVHVMMNIADEDLVSKVVAWLFPAVSWDGTSYRSNLPQ